MYQWIVALFHIATGYPLDQSGRLVSLVFFCTTLLPVYGLARIWFDSRVCALLLVCLVVLNPVYIFWSRTFLIETTVLFLSMCFLYFFTTSIHKRRIRDTVAAIAIAIAIACLAGWVKTTTFAIFLVAAGFVLMPAIVQRAGVA
ncbi:MAG: 4-amino-4-deoxy-L-arabinose transferase-like glycosyltransferase, partial [Gammaproteobacteria bacterium]